MEFTTRIVAALVLMRRPNCDIPDSMVPECLCEAGVGDSLAVGRPDWFPVRRAGPTKSSCGPPRGFLAGPIREESADRPLRTAGQLLTGGGQRHGGGPRAFANLPYDHTVRAPPPCPPSRPPMSRTSGPRRSRALTPGPARVRDHRLPRTGRHRTTHRFMVGWVLRRPRRTAAGLLAGPRSRPATLAPNG